MAIKIANIFKLKPDDIFYNDMKKSMNNKRLEKNID